MTTLSFTASNGKRYSLLALPNKLTSPSLKVDSSYVPCFTGNTESEVTSGEYIYTLSPMKVGSTRAAYTRRLSFGATGHVYVQVTLGSVVLDDKNDEFVYSWFNSWIERVYTNMAGYTAHINVTSTNEGLRLNLFAPTYDYYWDGTYTVTHDASGSTVASGPFSIRATARVLAPILNIVFSEQQTFTIK